MPIASSIFRRPAFGPPPSRWALRKPYIESLEVRHLLANDWTNPDQPLDVSADRWIGPLDVLIIINRLEERNNSGGEGNGLGTRGVAPFVDVNGDGTLSPLDMLHVVNSLNNQSPLVFTKLTNDTAAGGGTNSDRISADASIEGSIQYAKSKDRIFAGWDIVNDLDLKDITSARNGINFELREEAITQLIGRPLAPGLHTLTVVLRRDAVERFRSSFNFTVDRTAI